MQPIKNLIPHEPPMRLIDRVSGFVDDAAVAEAVITVDNPFVEGDVLEPVAYAELAAQAFAGGKGADDSASGAPPKKGLLVAIRDLTVTGTSRVGDVLRVSVEKTGDFGAFTVVEGTIACNNEVVATVSLRVWVED